MYLMMGIAAFLFSGMQADAMEDVYRNPSLSGPIQTWVYQGEDYENSRNRVFADDQEDGDLTAVVKQSNSVDTSKPGSCEISWEVKDSDGRTAQMTTQVKVLSRTAPPEDKTVQRRLYTLPDASHMTDIGFYRGYYHDRQSLGFWIPEGEELKIRLVNGEEFKQELELKFMNDDSDTENMSVIKEKTDGTANETAVEESAPASTVYIPPNGEWVRVKNSFVREDGTKGSAVSVPFIITPKNTAVQPVIEISWNDSFQSIPYYRYKDDQKEFFREWDESQAPFAIIEGDAATFLVPIVDRNNIINNSSVSEAYRFQTIDAMLEWYAAFVKQYDRYSGLDYDASETYNQNVRSKFFIKVNNSGIGLAYYTIDHSAHNGEYSGGSLGGYLTKDWVSLHEFGHGYEGSIAQQEHPFVETTNNILGYYFEPTYRPESDFGWLLGGVSGSTKAERYKALGERAENRKRKTSSFAGIVDGALHYDVSLFMFTNALDKLGPEKTTAAMHTQYRKYCYENGQTVSSSDVITESFSRTGGYNMVPYFDGWHIHPSEKTENEIYDLELPMLYELKNLVVDDAACETVRKKLGLSGIYSLVSTDDLADTGYTSRVSLKIEIDDLSQIMGKKIRIKNGSKTVKELEITGKSLDTELPVGIYEVELPVPDRAAYRYEKEYLAAAKGNTEKKLTYTRVKNPLVSDTKIEFLGLSDCLFAEASVNAETDTLLWSVYKTEPHYVFEDTYAGITVLNPSGREIFSQLLVGNQTPEESRKEVSFPVGSKIKIYHREATGRLKFVSRYTGKSLSAYELFGNVTEVSYIMTEKGLMQEAWDEDMQMDAYLKTLSSYSESMMEGMTRTDLYQPEKFQNQKTTVAQAYSLLNERAQASYLEKYGVLVGKEPAYYTKYGKLDASRLTGSADSDQGGGEAAELAVDGNEDTLWHSNYGNGAKPDLAAGLNNGYTILLDRNTDIGRLEYVPRSYGENGIIRSFRLLYSPTENGNDFQEIPVGQTDWANDNSRKSVDFDAPNARRIRIEALSTWGDPADTYISAAEFCLYEKTRVAAPETYLSSLYLETSDASVKKDKNAAGNPILLSVNGRQESFSKGIGMAAGASVTVDLTGKAFDGFYGMAGVDASQTGEAVFEIYGDGSLLYQSETLTAEDEARTVYLDVSGISRLELRTKSISGNALVSFGNAGFRNSKDLTELTLKVGESAAVAANASLLPENRGKILWESSDSGIAAVNEDGVVTAGKEGTAVISGKTGTETITCRVTVEMLPDSGKNQGGNTEIKEPVTGPKQPPVTDSKVTKPKKTVIKKVKPGKKQAEVFWKKTAKADGYEVWMRMGKGSFKKAKTVSAKKLRIKIRKLKKGKKYTFKVRAYRRGTGTKKVYGAFSKAKTVRIK